MAFAKLVFNSTHTVGQKLKDMAKVCSGAATSVADLEFADQVQSYIVTTEPAGWTLADANSALEATGTATRNSYRLSAPTVAGNKTKYCELSVWDSPYVDWNNNNTRTSSRFTATSVGGQFYAPIGTGTAGTDLVNPVWRNQFQQDILGTTAYTRIGMNFGSTALTIFISVTARKLCVHGPSNVVANPGPCVVLNLEFPETAATTRYNNLPFLNINVSNTGANNVGEIQINRIGGSGGSNSEGWKTAWFTDWYDETTDTRASRNMELTSTTNNLWIGTPPSLTVNNSGASLYPLVPFYDLRKNGTAHNYSSLTDVYYTYRTSSYATQEDEITVGSDTYVILQIGTTPTTNYRALAFKKA
jgi:hypothetical protein